MAYREIMKKHGASEKQLSSKTAKILLSALAEENGFMEEGAREAVEIMKADMDTLEKRQNLVINKITDTTNMMTEHEAVLKELIESSEAITKKGKQVVLQDSVAIEAFNLYRCVLDTTMDMIREKGEKEDCSRLSEKAIDAGVAAMKAFFDYSGAKSE